MRLKLRRGFWAKSFISVLTQAGSAYLPNYFTMSNKRKRVIGTTEEYVAKAEGERGRRLPPSFRLWLMENNGRSIEYLDLSRPRRARCGVDVGLDRAAV